jgi:hypothetical protein
MTIIWGGGTKSKNPGDAVVPFWCSREGGIKYFAVFENYRYGHLYGIRIAKWDTRRWIECIGCEFKVPIPTKQHFLAALSISETWKVLWASNPTNVQVMELVGMVAEEVVSDHELAQALRKASKEINE